MKTPRFPWLALAGAAMCSLAVTAAADANILYGASGANGVAGELYILDPATGGVVQDIGALRNAAGAPYSITGLAFQPGTGTLFGSTANHSPTTPAHLVRIDPATAVVTNIGPFAAGSTMADITFDPTTAILYGWRAGNINGLFTIDITTGLATFVGGDFDDFGGGGLAAFSDGTLFSTPDGATTPDGNLMIIDRMTGNATLIAPLSDKPINGTVNAMDFDGDTLFGVLTNRSGPTAGTHLVTINLTTAQVTDIGLSVNDLDGIAFAPDAPATPEPASLILIGSAAIALLTRAGRPRAHTPAI